MQRKRKSNEEALTSSLVSPMIRHWVGAWKDVLDGQGLSADVLSALTVAAVALPLNLALAVASGMPASSGLIAGALAGVVAGALGGAPLQVTGPAAALSTMVLAIANEFGTVGVAATCIMVGIVEVGLGFFGAGRLAKHVPEAVLAGFTTGVGLKLLDQQVPELLGFEQMGHNYKLIDLAAMMHMPRWLHHVNWSAVMCGLLVAFMVTVLKPYKRFPAALLGIALTTFIARYLHWNVETVGAVPTDLPSPSVPIVPDERWLDLALAAGPLALLAAAESLLAARAVDRMAPHLRAHEPNLELLGQGVANIAVGFVGGLPVSGVIVRSGVNVQSGARTRLAAILHGVLLLVSVLYLGRYISHVPIASLAGLLCVVALRLVEWREFRHLVLHEKAHALAFALAAGGTLSGHLMLGLVSGIGVHWVHGFLHRHEAAAVIETRRQRKLGVRGIMSREGSEGAYGDHFEPLPEHGKWLENIRGRILSAKTAFTHPQASVVGRVVLGDHVHIAAGSSVRADEGSPFYIGANTNLQDGVIVHALKDRHVLVAGERWAVFIGKNVSVAHNAIVHGPCFVGDDSFIGFKAVVHDSIVGAGCFIGHGAMVIGVDVPEGRFVPNGRVVDNDEAARALPPVSEAHREFNEDVVEVNRGLSAAYHKARGGTKGADGRVRRDHGPQHLVWDERWVPVTEMEKF